MTVQTLDIETFLHCNPPLIDVRSPSEHAHGHIPGSVNIPLFDDQERATIGQTYHQQGHQPAVLAGLEIAGPKMRSLVERSQAIASKDRVRVLCWRGGQRSRSFSWLLDQAGIDVERLEGGYKAYRQHVQRQFSDPLQIVILSGLTGSGKTILLQHLISAGEQVIDLESLANHRGSAFGGIGLPPQPTTEQFENDLFAELSQMDRSQRIWIEDESAAIGKVRIPDPLWDQMRLAPVVFIEVPKDARVQILLNEYGQMPIDSLSNAIEQIAKRLGGDRKQAALQALDQADRTEAIRIVLEYYDRAYKRSCSKRQQANAHLVRLSDPTQASAAQHLITHVHQLQTKKGINMKTLIASLGSLSS